MAANLLNELENLERRLEALAGKRRLALTFRGRSDGALPKIGELDPDNVSAAIAAFTGAALPAKKPASALELPQRDMTFCAGCPHRATFHILKRVLRQEKNPGVVIGDIGCYIMSGQFAGQYAFQACNCTKRWSPSAEIPPSSTPLCPAWSTPCTTRPICS